ncbi:SCO3933 family regulatory protein [Kitasatospora sp. HPMI-4]|uniref:SCO3933 family regulatory protein n=1 Tax=Kitasatospora sp. HPMI-4 TaxID=3448443 RepID=UPI003F1AEA84
MQSIPVDVARLGTMTCIVAPEARLANRETGEIKKDRDGQTVFTVGVAVRQEGRRASIIEISVSGEPVGVTEGVRVAVSGLVAVSWAMGDRHGLSFRADAITPTPAAAPAAAAARKGGDA